MVARRETGRLGIRLGPVGIHARVRAQAGSTQGTASASTTDTAGAARAKSRHHEQRTGQWRESEAVAAGPAYKETCWTQTCTGAAGERQRLQREPERVGQRSGDACEPRWGWRSCRGVGRGTSGSTKGNDQRRRQRRLVNGGCG